MDILEQVRNALLSSGFPEGRIHTDFEFGQDCKVDLAAFCQAPEDIRSSAAAYVTTTAGKSEQRVKSCRGLGSPIVFVWTGESLEWWKQTAGEPERIYNILPEKISGFFRRKDVQKDLKPQDILRAKTLGRVDEDYQSHFVDIGLMNMAEKEIGSHVSELIGRVILQLRQTVFPDKEISNADGQWLFKVAFWLLAGKILKDKQVDNFIRLDLYDAASVLERVRRHHNNVGTPQIVTKGRKRALTVAAETIAKFASMRLLTTESLAYIYENTLITRATRQNFGTHSTPGHLIDYMVWQLIDWIEDIPESERYVFEPACGHAGFLVSATRVLRELLGDVGLQERKRYLRGHIVGCELDGFALEVARLSLTLADIPNPNNWKLHKEDMFIGNNLSQKASQARILFANPPFEKFSDSEQERYKRNNANLAYQHKSTEMIARTIPHLPQGSVFGVVVPQGFLHSKDARPIREDLLRTCEFREIALFADTLFTKADAESAILIGRKNTDRCSSTTTIQYARVRENDVVSFKQSYAISSRKKVPQNYFLDTDNANLKLPDLNRIWEYCQNLPVLKSIADIRRGIEYIAETEFPEGQVKRSFHRSFKHATKGFPMFKRYHLLPNDKLKQRSLHNHQLPTEAWMNLSKKIIKNEGSGSVVNVPQILVNRAPVSRGPWRLKALMDTQGHPISNRILAIRPKTNKLKLEFLWALCNSPLANAFMFCNSEKRENLEGTFRSMPIPNGWQEVTPKICTLVSKYFASMPLADDEESIGPLLERHKTGDKEIAKKILLEIDAEILRLYDLPPVMEREMLDLFDGEQRRGVPFAFNRYYPKNFLPCFPLYEYISKAFKNSTIGKIKTLHEKETDPDLIAALDKATDEFGEDD